MGVALAIGIPLGYGFCWAIQEFYTLPGDVYYLSRIPVNIKIVDVLTVALSALNRSPLAFTLESDGRVVQRSPGDAHFVRRFRLPPAQYSIAR